MGLIFIRLLAFGVRITLMSCHVGLVRRGTAGDFLPKGPNMANVWGRGVGCTGRAKRDGERPHGRATDEVSNDSIVTLGQ